MDPQPITNPIVNPIVNIALVNPEIPNNTGSIGRTCVATGAALHLIHPLAFDIDEKACRRAGLDYWPRLNLTSHDSLQDYQASIHQTSYTNPKTWYLSARAKKSIYDITPTPGDHFVFGKESVGLPKDLLDAHPEQCLSIPIAPDERSLNLSTACAVVIYTCINAFIRNGHLQTSSDGRLVLSQQRIPNEIQS